jgi:hypothetical protein
MATKNRVRLIYAATAIALLAMAGGMVLATVLTTTTVNQNASFYQGGNNGANGFSTPTLSVASTPTGTTTCSTGTTGTTNGGTVNLVLSSTTGGTTCTAGNFAEEFSFAFSATITTQINSFTITTQVGAGAVQTNTASVSLGTGTSGAYTQTIDVFVDYGSILPPAGGITVLNAVVQ